jgi:hypothetical protein
MEAQQRMAARTEAHEATKPAAVSVESDVKTIFRKAGDVINHVPEDVML